MGARLDQHFLVSEAARDSIIAAARLSKSDHALEIGPGRGILTRRLLEEAGRVTAVEMDDRLAPKIAAEFASPRFTLIHEDFLALDLSRISPVPVVVVANLPYSVGAPILQRILTWPHWSSAVLMFQKEVAQRVAACPGDGHWGLLGLSARLYAEVEPVLDVPRGSFTPPPKVDSAVVRLVRRSRPLLPPERHEAFFKVARAAFGQRRKMAVGAIASALGLPRARVGEAFKRLNVPPDSRPETVALEAFLRLPDELGL